MNIAHWLARAALSHGSMPATAIGSHIAHDYASLGLRAARLAATLRAQCEPGDRVAIFAKNSPAYAEAIYGIWHAGLAAVPINAKLHGREAAYILEHSEAKFCFVSKDLEAEIAPHVPASLRELIRIASPAHEKLFIADAMPVADRGGDDLAWLFYTSGTTGRPKGAMLTHRNLNWASHAYLSEVNPIPPGAPVLHAAPMSHGSGLYMMPHVARLGINAVPESGGFEPEEIFAMFRALPGTSMFAAPTMVKRLVESPADCDPSLIRTIAYGGAPMYVEDALAALDRFGSRFAQIYGQGESPMTITTLTKEDIADRDHPRWMERLGSVGRPYACLEAKVGSADAPCLAPGEIGEILARGDVVMGGYWKNHDATAATLNDGWLHTGDVGAFDADGYLTLKDRSKDMVISGGSNIYPREIEEVLLQHPAVREVSVIGRPHPEWGEIVVAYVVGETSATELDTLCLDHIARFKRPKDYVFVPALPKNNYGKILKTELREMDERKARD
ncbi:long-chain-fatty-acid--CoA ligase [Variibacter gotjawalensis]|uniref:3-methylmercaptopropionyl-CoA ligase n=1 Tax=Variibacter gotjawalensis TaxID=1333996 RepID=A0A0S3PSI5_9BRAD|nr:AMP-binding protein [Variibacter gotjawalensis]NIK49126.1 long-chain acyl-CoA synthetase [Variibacter gotjawalensis]RZS50982.1 long-chain acyl-CoA synthetase [Variibacter gotjawalensis]BAT58816.1 long-chain-fatty-acid--CoA ligase [Variibacter gotjawalensis]